QTLGVGHYRLDFLDAAEHGAEGDELAVSDACDQAGERGFADAGRTPKNDRAELVAFDLLAQRLARPEDVLLPDEAVEGLRPHALGQGTPLVARSVFGGRSVVEQAHGSGDL